MDREMSITNYESALEWGRLGFYLDKPGAYHKVSKTPTIHYETSRPGPIVISEGQSMTTRAELPLVNHLGSLAS